VRAKGSFGPGISCTSPARAHTGWMRGRWLLLMALIAGGCSLPGARLGPGEISARELPFLPLARTGMYMVWTDEHVGKVGEWSIACVEASDERVCVEWRRTDADGRSEVTAARFRPDGSIEGAWRGAPGGKGVRLRVVDADVGKEMEAELAYAERATG